MSDVTVVVLSFARASAAGDPYAFRLGFQEYILVGAGGGTSEAQLSWDEALLADLAAIRRPNHDPGIVQRLGEKLREFLTPAGWPQHEARILESVRAQRKVVLIVRSSAAEIYALPWELLTIKSTGQQVGELPNVLLCYEWPETVSTPPSLELSELAEKGRILMAWSAAGGAIPVAEHTASIQRACQSAGRAFALDRDVLAHVSLRKLADALDGAQKSGRPISVLHLLCHGQAAGGNFGLALDGDDASEPAVIDAAGLRRVLAPYAAMVQLVVLAACDSGNSGDLGNRLGSLAQALHRIGIAKVVASRYPLGVASSNRLADVLYRELYTKQGSVESALLQVRQELFKDSSHLDWASLQLYARGADGFFKTPAAPVTKPATSSSQMLRWAALAAVAIAPLALGAHVVMKRLSSQVPQVEAPKEILKAIQPAPTQLKQASTPEPIAPPLETPTENAPKSVEATPIKKVAQPATRRVVAPNSDSSHLFNVRVFSEAGNVIRVDGHSKTAARVQAGNQAEATFQLPAGTHRVSCTDSVSHQSADVSLRVGDGEKNEAPCYPP